MDALLFALALCSYPIVFVVLSFIVARKHRMAQAKPASVGGRGRDALAMVRAEHPSVVAALAGHPELSGLTHENRRMADCALAALLHLVERGCVRVHVVAPEDSERLDAAADSVDSVAPNGQKRLKRKADFEQYDCYRIERDAHLTPESAYDRIALEVFFPYGEDTISLADVLTWMSKRWRTVLKQLEELRRELDGELREKGYAGEEFRASAVLRRWPFRIAVAWVIAALIVWAVTYGSSNPFVLIIAVAVVLTPTAGFMLPEDAMLTPEGSALGIAALTVCDTLSVGVRKEALLKADIDEDEASMLLYAGGKYPHAQESRFKAWHHKPEAWVSMFEITLCDGRLRCEDGPDAYTTLSRRLTELVNVAPDDVKRDPAYAELSRWLKLQYNGESEVPGPAIAIHDRALLESGDFTT